MKLRLHAVGLATLVIAAGVLSIHSGRKTKAAEIHKDFTVTYEERSHGAISNRALKQQFVEAHRADHSFTRFSPLDRHIVRTVFLASEKKEVKINEIARLKSTYDYSRAEMPPDQPVVNRQCERSAGFKAQLLGEEEVLGFATYKYRSETGRETGEMLEERITWYAPALNCYPLRMDATRKKLDGTVLGTFHRVPLGVTVGVPDPTLFSVEPYTEVLPSILETKALERKLDADGVDSGRREAVMKSTAKYMEAQDARYKALKEQR